MTMGKMTLETVLSAADTLSEIVQQVQALPESVDATEAAMAFTVAGTYLADLSIALSANISAREALKRMIAGDTPVM
jgi:hypothetical protein